MTEVAEQSAELTPYEPGEALAMAERMFPPERREQIAQFLEVPADHPAFLPFLAISAAYGLNPTMGEIWLIPQNVREKVNGQWQTVSTKYKPSVGRDGLLSIARRDPSYLGIKSDVVCANDEFVVKHDTRSFDAPPEITHTYAPKEAGKDPRRSRGPVIGAWAILYLRNRPPVYYFADAAEHAKTKMKDGVKQYDGAWSYTSSMLIKAATSYVLRLGIGVTGLLPADEMQLPTLEQVKEGAALEEHVGGEPAAGGGLDELWAGIEESAGTDVAEALRARFEGTAPAEIEMTLTGLDADALTEMAALPPVTDAEVVPEGEAPTAPENAGGEPGEDRTLILRKRREELLAAEAEMPGDEASEEITAELSRIDDELAALGAVVPGQEAML